MNRVKSLSLVLIILLLVVLYYLSMRIGGDTSRQYVWAAVIVTLSWSIALAVHLIKAVDFVLLFFASSIIRIFLIAALSLVAIKVYSLPSMSLLLWVVAVYAIFLVAETLLNLKRFKHCQKEDKLFKDAVK